MRCEKKVESDVIGCEECFGECAGAKKGAGPSTRGDLQDILIDEGGKRKERESARKVNKTTAAVGASIMASS
jgi:hypothetical protein